LISNINKNKHTAYQKITPSLHLTYRSLVSGFNGKYFVQSESSDKFLTMQHQAIHQLFLPLHLTTVVC